MSSYPGSGTRLGRIVNSFEETFIAFLLGMMVIVTFVNVVLRYLFNSSLIWGLEVTLILFAWLVLFGIAYAFKVTAHLGVDALLNMLPPKGKRVLALVSLGICMVYVLLLLKGSWDYWAPFAGLPPTEGRWFPTGINWGARNNSFMMTEQVPMLDWLRFLEPITLNRGYPEAEWDHWDKLPRFLPYAMLPVATALMLYRLCQVGWRIITGRQDSLIVSHEAEEDVAAVAAMNRDEETR
ncbi:TRAP transporter small permease [Vannielia litorea]|uniref:TRAP transporter small permease protein n=1 Tax=Vannielia litorea TaxID=1217970 RepID=A0A1N6FRE3_9RHOB|nr:TRAP transporter small permease [Vannielia litorea]SIN97808.1 C4-dicarboxylate transporter, DctQ subunit [Vannielia litorea]